MYLSNLFYQWQKVHVYSGQTRTLFLRLMRQIIHVYLGQSRTLFRRVQRQIVHEYLGQY
jgi:hypothetical protein